MIFVMVFFKIFFQKMTDEEETEKEKRIQRIKTLFAFDLFSQHRFEESLQTFATLGTGKWWWNCVILIQSFSRSPIIGDILSEKWIMIIKKVL